MGKLIQVKPGYMDVLLPNSDNSGTQKYYQAGGQVTVTDAEYAGFGSGTLVAITIVTSGLPDPVRTPSSPAGSIINDSSSSSSSVYSSSKVDSLVGTVSTAVSTETTRAEAAEATNASNITAANTAITNEVSRAEAAEATNATNIATANTAITNETTRATTAEGTKAPKLAVATSVQTSAFTLTTWKPNLASVASSSYAATLPTASAAGAGAEVPVKVTAASATPGANALTITAAGSDTINGSGNTLPLRLADQAKVLVSDGVSNWTVVSGDLSITALSSYFGSSFVPTGGPTATSGETILFWDSTSGKSSPALISSPLDARRYAVPDSSPTGGGTDNLAGLRTLFQDAVSEGRSVKLRGYYRSSGALFFATQGASLSGDSPENDGIYFSAGYLRVGTARADAATVTNGSPVVADTSITTNDAGRPVDPITGVIPAGCYVGTVIAGTSFRLSSSKGTQADVNATGSATNVVLGQNASYTKSSCELTNFSVYAPKSGTSSLNSALLLDGQPISIVEAVHADLADIGFDMINNCGGTEFRNCTTTSAVNLFSLIRATGQSGSDITFDNCWAHGAFGNYCLDGATDLWIRSGQANVNQQGNGTIGSNNWDSTAPIIVGRSWGDGTVGTDGLPGTINVGGVSGNINVRDVDFEGTRGGWVAMRSYGFVNAAFENNNYISYYLNNVNGAGTVGTSPAAYVDDTNPGASGLIKMTNAGGSTLTVTGGSVKGAYQSRALLNLSGSSNFYLETEKVEGRGGTIIKNYSNGSTLGGNLSTNGATSNDWLSLEASSGAVTNLARLSQVTVPYSSRVNGAIDLNGLIARNGSGNLQISTDGVNFTSVASGSFAPAPQFARKTADATAITSATTGTTLVDDTDLVFTVAANHVYRATGILVHSATQTSDIAYGWNMPSGTLNGKFLGALSTLSSTTSQINVVAVQSASAQVIGGEDTAGTTPPIVKVATLVDFMFVIGSTGGPLKLQWAQGTSSTDQTILKSSSYLQLEFVA